MKAWGTSSVGRRILVSLLALALVLAVAGPASAGAVQNSPAETQYGNEQPPATETPEVDPQAEPEIFLPPTVASAGQDESGDSGGLLPFTGAALIVPSVLGGLLLAGGLFLVYRTRRRET